MAGSRFPTTRWSVVLVAGEDPQGARDALSSLCEAYWGPLYAFVRRRGFGPEDAQDLTQGFLLGLLEREDLRRVHPHAGRFRSFLCASVKHFISNEMERARALKRGGGAVTLSFDARQAESQYRLEPRDDLDPEKVFERRWAFTVLRRAEARLARELGDDDRQQDLEHVFPLVAGAGPRGSYAEVAAALGISEDAVKMKVHRLRRRFGRLVREEIADTVADPDEVDDELRHLLTIVRD
jgi:RNA polymerase sigma-70 factor (ECF subfamily)